MCYEHCMKVFVLYCSKLKLYPQQTHSWPRPIFLPVFNQVAIGAGPSTSSSRVCPVAQTSSLQLWLQSIAPTQNQRVLPTPLILTSRPLLGWLLQEADSFGYK